MKHVQKNLLRGLGICIIVLALFFVAREARAPGTIVPPSTTGIITTSPSGEPFDPASVSVILTEKATGKQYVSNQLIVEFAPEVSEEKSLAIIADVHGVMLQRFTKVPLFLVQIKDLGDGSGAAHALQELRANPKVKNVTLNYLSGKSS